MNLETQRLYLLYKSGSTREGRNNSNLLQLAKSIGSDLSESEFDSLATQVLTIEKQFDRVTQSKEFQAALWSLPDEAKANRESFFRPIRTKDNQPIYNDPTETPEQIAEKLKKMGPGDVKHSSPLRNAWHAAQSGELGSLIDPTDPDGTQARFKNIPYDSVANNPMTRDAWHAAKSGKLAELLRNGDLWQASTDPQIFQSEAKKFGSDRSNFSSPIKSLMESSDRGELEQRMELSRKNFSRNEPTHQIYSDPVDTVVKRLSSSDNGQWKQHYFHSPGVDASHFPESNSPNDVRKYVNDMRTRHERNVGQKLVDYQVKNYSAPKRSAAPSVSSTASSVASFSDMRKNVVSGKPYDGKSAAEITKEWSNPDPGSSPNGASGKQSPAPLTSMGGSFMDRIQLALDAIGVVEPTPFADLTNTGISLVRAAMDPENAGQHLTNAAISAIGVVPYVGDVAKLAKGYDKAGKAGKTIGKSMGAPADSFLSKNGSSLLDHASSALGNKAYGGNSSSAGGTGGIGGGGAGNGGNGAGGVGGGGSGGLIPFGQPPGSPVSGSGSSIDWSKLFGSLSSVVKTSIDRFKQLNDWVHKSAEQGRILVETNRKYAMYSGELSLAYMKYDANSERRTMNEATYLGSSAAALAKARSRVEDAESYANKPSQRTANNVLAKLGEIDALITEARAFFSIRHLIERSIYDWIDATSRDDDKAKNPFEVSLREMNVENKPKVKRLPADGDMKK